ncbi:MAG: Eco57I restriction-modification methylase domain-containing protein [Promethearchaeota archaeon]
MIKQSSKKFFQEFINNFENKKLKEKKNNQTSGEIYTPQEIADFIVCNIFKIFFKDIIGGFNADSDIVRKKQFDLESLKLLIKENLKFKEFFYERIKNIKILDPSCGSGRFLISIAEYLLKIYKILNLGLKDFDLKKKIIQNNIFGIEIDKPAFMISKFRLLTWLYSRNITILNIDKNISTIEDLSSVFNELEINFNLYNLDFLLEFGYYNWKSAVYFNFDIIIGNPPYIENKKIFDLDFKRKLYKKFKSAYKLFDLSIIFLEKSIKLLKNNGGYISFILTNKFLAADYGIKIREILVNHTELKEIINISTLPVFSKAATYPIILSLRKGISNNTSILIKKYDNLEKFINLIDEKTFLLPQSLIKTLPAHVIPISGNINLLNYLFLNFKPMSIVIKDLKIIYRPFGFIKWAKHFENISENRDSDNDLLLIGTGNVGKFHVKFDKRIRIAKNDFKISYFKFNSNFEKKWKELSCEKLIFREIAKDLTWVYDPGIYANITGLYFTIIPSFDTDKLFCLLTIMNSNLMDLVFKTLFGTLHMSAGYLRFNGSFIKRLPLPERFPISLSRLGKIIQFLSQLKYDLNSKEVKSFKGPEIELFMKKKSDGISTFLKFFIKLSNSMVYLLYLNDIYSSLNLKFKSLNKLLNLKEHFLNIQFKYLLPRFNLLRFKVAQLMDIKSDLNEISSFYMKMIGDNNLLKEIKYILKIGYPSG